MAKVGTKNAAISAIKAASLGANQSNDRLAIKTFRNQLDHDEQVALIREIVDTRRSELTLAYKSLIDVSLGYKRKTVRRRRSGKKKSNTAGTYTRIQRQPCVVFEVKQKWRPEQATDSQQALPGYLYAYWTRDGERLRCAVPTDVVDVSHALSITPQATRENILVDSRSSVGFGKGTVTCAVRREGSANTQALYALSCRHVFSMSNEISHSIWNTRVLLEDQATLVARTRGVYGELLVNPGSRSKANLDAQLAEVVDWDSLAPTLRGLSFPDHARDLRDFPREGGSYNIYTTRRNRPIKATFLREKRNYPIKYKGVGGFVTFDLVYLFRPDVRTFGGDSGSPIADPLTGSLVGMLIGGNGDDPTIPDGNLLVAMLPAWEVLNPRRYRGPKSQETWEIVEI